MCVLNASWKCSINFLLWIRCLVSESHQILKLRRYWAQKCIPMKNIFYFWIHFLEGIFFFDIRNFYSCFFCNLKETCQNLERYLCMQIHSSVIERNSCICEECDFIWIYSAYHKVVMFVNYCYVLMSYLWIMFIFSFMYVNENMY